MWLLNVRSKQLEYFNDTVAFQQGYAILSHVWNPVEITFQDLSTAKIIRGRKGFPKLYGTCRQAVADGIGYVWIDTCCIDKTSSAELSEAINSMFRWYKRSIVCYVYMDDISEEPGSPLEPDSPLQLRRSRWFTRGWTLQELIAPSHINFYDRDWKFLGTKEQLCSELELCTGIPEYILHNCEYLGSVSVANKMSWAAERQTTRPEDMAYCLLGLFDVNMPLLYGEGSNAFYRLQEAIMRQSTDHSILMWKPLIETSRPRGTLLAWSPKEFKKSHRVVQHSTHVHDAFELTNVGIRMNLPVFESHGKHFILLDCRYEDDFTGIIGLEVELIGSAADTPDGMTIVQRSHRVQLFPTEVLQSGLHPKRTRILLVSHDYKVEAYSPKRIHGLKIWFQRDSICSEMLKVDEARPIKRWSQSSQVVSWSGAMFPYSDAREGSLLVIPRKSKENYSLENENGKSFLLLMFTSSFASSKGATQECFFKAVTLEHRPAGREIEELQRLHTGPWTVVENNCNGVEHILLHEQILREKVKVSVTHELIMSTPVYVLRLACDAVTLSPIVFEQLSL